MYFVRWVVILYVRMDILFTARAKVINFIFGHTTTHFKWHSLTHAHYITHMCDYIIWLVLNQSRIHNTYYKYVTHLRWPRNSYLWHHHPKSITTQLAVGHNSKLPPLRLTLRFNTYIRIIMRERNSDDDHPRRLGGKIGKNLTNKKIWVVRC